MHKYLVEFMSGKMVWVVAYTANSAMRRAYAKWAGNGRVVTVDQIW